MRAIYNDTERFACDWLQHLMDAGLIMPGKIDDRSIADLSPDDLAGFERVHLFAGIGGWDRALQLAGWRDGPVWTCSCPCPPFSQAGKRQSCPRCSSGNLVWCPRRTGYCLCADCSHAWLADGRHLWPEAWRLIARCRPSVVFGEQVASPDGLEWLAGVRASLEILSYAPWGTDYPAAGVGAPNIRQRLWWLADADGGLAGNGYLQPGWQHGQQPEDGGTDRLADTSEPRRGEQPGRHGGEDGRPASQSGRLRDAVGMAHRPSDGRREERALAGGVTSGDRPEGRPAGLVPGGEPDRLANTSCATSTRQRQQQLDVSRTGGVESPWSDFDIIHCTDGKARRIPQSSLLRLVDGLPDGVVRGSLEGAEGFPLAEGADNRVGRLKGYGNSVNPYAAARIIRAWRDVRNA